MPAHVDGEVVEQRILEEAVRLPPTGAVTAWASLRWRGATFFDGLGRGGNGELAVPVLVGADRNIRSRPGGTPSHEHFPASERELVEGVPCSRPERAVFDELRRVGDLRGAVVTVDMAIAAGLTSLEAVTAFVSDRPGWPGVRLARRALPWVDGASRSPQETRMRLVWMIDAGRRRPLCNVPVFDLNGNFLGKPDLLDPVLGVVGEYNGGDHRDPDRHRSDVRREEGFRGVGLEYFTVVGGELGDRRLVVRRMQNACERAERSPESGRAWTLEKPPWWRG